jgi:rare lipoprotein A (peptidoglycan hydrolase)
MKAHLFHASWVFLLFFFAKSPASLRPTEGFADCYNYKFQGKATKSGEMFDHNQLTCAHRTLPFGTVLKVTNLETKKFVRLKVNDRGPYVVGTIIDVTRAAAERLDMLETCRAEVSIEVIDDAQSRGNQQVNVGKHQNSIYPVAVPAVKKPVQTKSKSVLKTPAVVDYQLTHKGGAPTTYQNRSATENPKAATKTVPSKNELPKGLYSHERLPAGKPAFALQLGAYSTLNAAMNQVNILEAKGLENLIVDTTGAGSSNTIYKVMIGPFTTFYDADQTKSRVLKIAKIKGFVVKLK